MKSKEIVIISGKGGTGKTTLCASIIPYLNKPVIADCDVDAPDLYILLNPKIVTKTAFSGTKKSKILAESCIQCGECISACHFHAITDDFKVNPMKCEGCGVCGVVCQHDAIEFRPVRAGDLFISTTEHGPMVHARLQPGEETSGKLVSEVRQKAMQLAEKEENPTVIIDGSPGIGCSVIASITGAQQVIIVTEPSQSGLHDLKRVVTLAQKLSNTIQVVINKSDLSPTLTQEIEKYCQEQSIEITLKIPFNPDVVKAVSNREIPSIAEQDFYNSIGFQEFIQKLKDSPVKK